MRLIQLAVCHVLLITNMLYSTDAEAGCQTWYIDGDNVCCEKCNPGNRLLERCGADRSSLCTPCEPNSYTDDTLAYYCKRCRQCIDPQVEVKPCNASANTVCGCKSGFLCGNRECTYCVKECTKGQEPTNERNCRKCPDGTFNDKIHSACKPWTKSCPDGEQIIVHGNEFSDNQCGKGPDANPPGTSDNFFYALIGIFTGAFGLIIILFLLLWFAYKRTKNKKPSKDLKPTTPSQGELTFMIVHHEEACSFHQPEQEQGGSTESINTQDSESKLIV